MNKKPIMGLLGSLILFIPGNAYADHPTIGFGSEIAGPVTTISATSLPKGRWSIGLRTEYVKFDAFSDAELENFAQQGEEIHSTDYLLSPFLGASYGLTDDFTLGLQIPYILRNDIREGHLEDSIPEVHKHRDSKGIGDITLLGQYRFLNKKRGNFEVALLSGFKFPTGTTHAKDNDGGRFETEHQPGSGSWDLLIGIAVSKRLGRASLDTNLLYTFVTEGAQNTDLGNLLNYNVAVSYRLGGETNHHHSHESAMHHDHALHTHLAWNLILEINGEWRQKQKVGGIKDKNSGGSLVYISPGVRLTVGDHWSSSISIGLPVFQDLNGKQYEADLRIILAVGKGF